jgi:hypothetical protein
VNGVGIDSHESTPTAFIAVAIALAPAPALAGRPLTTEDATVLADKACQLEAWLDRSREATVGWLVPACNFGLGIEWQLGFSRERTQGTTRFPEAYAQAKGLFLEMDESSTLGVGWVAGVVRRPLNERHDGWDNPYVLRPVSVKAGAFTLHVQPGWSRDREAGRSVTVWGVAGEYAVNPAWDVVGEVFGENSARPFVRAGLRWTPVKGYLDIDLTCLTRPGGERNERLVSLGLTWYGPPILP